MIQLPMILTVARRYWPLIAIAAVAAWGGIGWWWKAAAERDFARYREQHARLVARQQEAIIEERARVDEISRQAVTLYQAGQQATEEHYAPHISALESLNRVYRERLRNTARAGGGTVSESAAAAGRVDASACEDRLQRVAEAAARVTADASAVARDLRDAELSVGRLVQLQAWHMHVGGAP